VLITCFLSGLTRLDSCQPPDSSTSLSLTLGSDGGSNVSIFLACCQLPSSRTTAHGFEIQGLETGECDLENMSRSRNLG
jgi:hypothetical protein